MAKGSLLGTADATLVSAAEKQAKANIPSDLGAIYESEKITADLFQTEVNTFFDELYAEHNKLSDDLKASVATVTENLSAGTMPNDEQIDLYTDYIGGLKDKLKTIPKGPKGERERQKITAELNRLKNSTDQMDATITELTTKINNNDYIPNATGSNNMKLLTAISNGSAKQEIVNGNLVYTLPGTDLRITQADLKKMVVSNDPTVNANFNKVHQFAGDQSGADWNNERQGIINNYENAFDTREGYAQNIHQKQGNMSHTFAEILQGKGDPGMNLQIFNALKEMGVEVPDDVDGDGKITEKDFATPENGIALIRSLTDITDPNFNFQAAKKIAAEFYTDNIAAKEFEEAGGVIGGAGMSDFDKAFAKARKDGLETFVYNGKEYGTELGEDDGTGSRTTTPDSERIEKTSFTFGDYATNVDKKGMDDIYSAMYKSTQGTDESPTFTINSPAGNQTFTWNNEENSWYQSEKNGKTDNTKIGSVEDLVGKLGLNTQPDFQALETFKSEETRTQENVKIINFIEEAKSGKFYGEYDWLKAGSGISSQSGNEFDNRDFLIAYDSEGNVRDPKGTTYRNLTIASPDEGAGYRDTYGGGKTYNREEAARMQNELLQAWTSDHPFFEFKKSGKTVNFGGGVKMHERFDFTIDQKRIARQYGQDFVDWLNSDTQGSQQFKFLLADDLTSKNSKFGYGSRGFEWLDEEGGAAKTVRNINNLTNKYMKEFGKAFAAFNQETNI